MNECLKHGKQLNVGSESRLDLGLDIKDLRLDLRLDLKDLRLDVIDLRASLPGTLMRQQATDVQIVGNR